MPKNIAPVELHPSGEGSEFSRREFLQVAGVGLVALGCSPILGAKRAISPSFTPKVDFQYSPLWWQTSICLPDDPDKVVVGREGQLLFDWGLRNVAGPTGSTTEVLRDFGIMLQPDLAGGAEWGGQATLSPQVPITLTSRRKGQVEVSEQIFVVTPCLERVSAPARLARMDVPQMECGIKPARECAPVFSTCAVGKPIQFQVAVDPGAAVTVVLGVCEGRFTSPHERTLILRVDGSPERTVDPIEDFGPSIPGLYRMTARDSDKNGVIDIFVDLASDSKAKEAMLNALWIFSGVAPSDQDIVAGRADALAIASFPAISRPSRRAIILMTLKNTGETETRSEPVLRVRSALAVALSESEQIVGVGAGTCIRGSLPLKLVRDENNVPTAHLDAVTLAPGMSREVVFTVDRYMAHGENIADVREAQALVRAAKEWWEESDLPYSAVVVPDADIQAILQSCVRNIWQARELKVGGPAFQVGPTCYRGLWVVDGSFLLEAVAILGRAMDARRGVEYLLSQQSADGGFEIIPRHWKENGIVLWAVIRHAFLTQDREWLRRQWPALRRVFGAIQRLRDSTLANPQALNYQLLPAGFIDGGIASSDLPEYSNLHWTLVGLKALIGAAHWVGDDEFAVTCASDYEALYAAFRRACDRDERKDTHGNAYVPTMMGDAGSYSPQKGQWAFCHAVYPGQVFERNDRLVQGQLAMLKATKVEGMVCDTGWLKSGIWTYFASFYGHAQLWQGQGREAAETLYAFAQHACPTRVWREEQMPLDRARESNLETGDMPHNWASAEFIRLTTHLLQIDRGDELHLMEGLPRRWVGPGMVTQLNGVLTPFGPLHMAFRVSDDGRRARLKVKKLTERSPARLVLHMGEWAAKQGPIDLPTDRDVSHVVKLV